MGFDWERREKVMWRHSLILDLSPVCASHSSSLIIDANTLTVNILMYLVILISSDLCIIIYSEGKLSIEWDDQMFWFHDICPNVLTILILVHMSWFQQLGMIFYIFFFLIEIYSNILLAIGYVKMCHRTKANIVGPKKYLRQFWTLK